MARRTPVHSAGIAVVRPAGSGHQLFLVHPGGPFWSGRDEHAWSIPKGLVEPGDGDGAPERHDGGGLDAVTIEATARREFTEETGQPVPAGDLIALEPFRIGSGKVLHPFALVVGPDDEPDADAVVSNGFEVEWPPRSGRLQAFPEIDRAGWFTLHQARTRLHKGQVAIVDLLAGIVAPLDGEP